MLSIIIPCYNEGKKLINNLKKVNDYMKNIDTDYEIIVVDDGSTDDTYTTLYSNLINITNTTIVSYSPNKGKGNAVREGFKKAKGDYVLFMDADLSTSIEAISKVMNIFLTDNSIDVIIANRRINNKTENKGILRKIVSKGCYYVTYLITGLNYIDTQCGFKAFKKEVAKDLANKQLLERFAFDVEYLYISKLRNYKVKEIGVTWTNDGDSRVKIVRDTIRFFKDLIVIRKNKQHYLI